MASRNHAWLLPAACGAAHRVKAGARTSDFGHQAEIAIRFRIVVISTFGTKRTSTLSLIAMWVGTPSAVAEEKKAGVTIAPQHLVWGSHPSLKRDGASAYAPSPSKACAMQRTKR